MREASTRAFSTFAESKRKKSQKRKNAKVLAIYLIQCVFFEASL